MLSADWVPEFSKDVPVGKVAVTRLAFPVFWISRPAAEPPVLLTSPNVALLVPPVVLVTALLISGRNGDGPLDPVPVVLVLAGAFLVKFYMLFMRIIVDLE